MEFYISKRCQRYGPYSIEELNRQIEAGEFDLGDFALNEGRSSWLTIRTLPGITVKPFAVQIEQPTLLIIRYRGRAGPKDVEQCEQKVRVALPKLRRGFQLVVDLTDLEFMDTTCAPAIEKIMDH